MRKEYSIIIATNQYSGNFEREMCAFTTGQVGECGVGDNKINPNFNYSVFDDVLYFKSDEHGRSRPVSIYPIAGRYTAVQIHFQEKPTLKMFNLIKERAPLYDHEVKILDVYVISEKVVTEREDVK